MHKNNQQIVCITYTNVAADEIIDRIENNPLVAVSTIHDFLWRVIKNYQIELKQVLVEYNQQKLKNPVANLEEAISKQIIEYSQSQIPT